MQNFQTQMGDAVSDPGKKGWLVAILELGAWWGVLWTGFLCDKLSRKNTIVAGETSGSADEMADPKNLLG
jgi:MFS family permease